ncbi:MAG TPA: DUF2892 domain-containing protein [Chloroflexi bacterium]|nr:DUF2892 domain-containing protein [Chloroflexota bacterium]
MKTNESLLDRIIRVVLGVVLVVIAYLGVLTGAWQWVAYVVGAIALITGIVGFCPLYAVFGFQTKK